MLDLTKCDGSAQVPRHVEDADGMNDFGILRSRYIGTRIREHRTWWARKPD